MNRRDRPSSVDRFCCAALILLQSVVWILLMPFQLVVDACKGWPEPEKELEKMSDRAKKLFESREALTEADLVLVQTLNDMLALISLQREPQFIYHLTAATKTNEVDNPGQAPRLVNFDEWWNAVLKIKGTTQFVTELVNDIGKS